MSIKDIKEFEIINDKKINSKFITASYEKLPVNCKFYKGDFYLDSFNYFPITKENYSFSEIYCWQEISKYDHFFSKDFYSKFIKEKSNFKTFENALILGTSPGDNYYRNLITFLPRLLFIKEKKVNLVIHRKSSNKLRRFLENILKIKGINLNKYIYIDNDFYYFKNSKIPQFLTKKASINLLNKVFKKQLNKNNRIYITSKNADYRKIINESDLIEELKSKNFKVIDLTTLSINQQIDIFSSSEIIVSATNSSLANIVFCNEGTRIFEITPQYKYNYENELKNRYSNICRQLNLKYYSMDGDPIEMKRQNKNATEFIDMNVINKSNYYKNLLVKTNIFKKFVEKI